jgi:hypothetical protein
MSTIDLNDTILESGAFSKLTEAAHEIIETYEAGEPITAETIAYLKEALQSDRIRAIHRFFREHSN